MEDGFFFSRQQPTSGYILKWRVYVCVGVFVFVLVLHDSLATWPALFKYQALKISSEATAVPQHGRCPKTETKKYDTRTRTHVHTRIKRGTL